jgi:hypothetical protein
MKRMIFSSVLLWLAAASLMTAGRQVRLLEGRFSRTANRVRRQTLSPARSSAGTAMSGRTGLSLGQRSHPQLSHVGLVGPKPLLLESK